VQVLQQGYARVMKLQFKKSAKQAAVIAKDYAWYEAQLSEMNRRLRLDHQHVMAQWDIDNVRLKNSATEYHEREVRYQTREAELLAENSKYRILWNHYFGFDHPLQLNLGKLHEKVNQLESALSLPATGKGGIFFDRKVLSISRLDFANIPLRIGEAPVLATDSRRFNLHNMTNRDIILRGFRLENEAGARYPIPADRLPRQGMFHCCVGPRDALVNNDKIILPADFTTFGFDSVIYLCDAHGGRVILFPNETEDISDFGGMIDDTDDTEVGVRFDVDVDEDEDVDEDDDDDDDDGRGSHRSSNTGPVLELTKIMSKDRLNPWTGIELTNCRGKPVRFLNCVLVVLSPAPAAEELFQTRIPEVAVPATGILRVVIGVDRVEANDIRIPPGISFERGTQLVMRDKHRHELLLYTQR
jgi:hypothetical protein